MNGERWVEFAESITTDVPIAPKARHCLTRSSSADMYVVVGVHFIDHYYFTPPAPASRTKTLLRLQERPLAPDRLCPRRREPRVRRVLIGETIPRPWLQLQ